MASRRVLTTSARLLPAAATTRVASVSLSARLFATPCTRTLAAASVPATYSHGVRFYSQKKGSVIPDSRIWEFTEITAHLKNPEANTIFVGTSARHPETVDVREPHELQETGKIPGAINIPITSAIESFHIDEADFEDLHGFQRPEKDQTLVFYCKAGVRAKSAAALAQHAGWKSVGEYPGSWLDWDAQKGPVEKK
ncbi:hypothetical protein Golomagni_05455 [Golovinomyces magnicellulatus]|nr:hypothetical protein Golomagni_05455 [Golovinomyces magnicellulatus]